jgi:peptidoglycan hydrolase-like protein with peptidoglycan-binding domain
MSLRTPRFRCDPQLRAAANNAPPLRDGARGEGVAILQQALIDLGFEMPASTAGGWKPPDGIYGRETTKTVAAFQMINRLLADGIAGRQTLQRLEERLIVAARCDYARLMMNMQGPPSRRDIFST